MKRTLITIALLVLPTGQLYAQGFADRLIAGYEAGMRLRMQRSAVEQIELNGAALREYYEQQVRLLEQQNRILQLQAEQAGRAQEQRETEIVAQATAEAKDAIQQFAWLRPNWVEYEQAMVTYSQALPPGQLDMVEYLDVLYFLARRDELNTELQSVAAERAQEVLEEFAGMYPDWQAWESRMISLAQDIQQRPGETDLEYLAALYRAAKER